MLGEETREMAKRSGLVPYRMHHLRAKVTHFGKFGSVKGRCVKCLCPASSRHPTGIKHWRLSWCTPLGPTDAHTKTMMLGCLLVGTYVRQLFTIADRIELENVIGSALWPRFVASPILLQ